ncbi:OmpH/Skp family outer membrane protein [Halanaerobaculum tunisiense]
MKKLTGLGLIGLIVVLVGAGLLINQTAQANKKPQVGYVDMQKLFNKHPQKDTSEGKLQGEAKKLQQRLETEAKDLSKQKRQELLREYQQKLDQLERQLVGEVMEEINQLISQVAEEKDIKLVVDKSAVITGGYDLTDEVLAKMEAKEEDKDKDKDKQEDTTQNNTEDKTTNQ